MCDDVPAATRTKVMYRQNTIGCIASDLRTLRGSNFAMEAPDSHVGLKSIFDQGCCVIPSYCFSHLFVRSELRERGEYDLQFKLPLNT